MLSDWRSLKPGEVYKDSSGHHGVVLVNFETGDCADGYELLGWGEEPGGLLIQCENGALVRLPGAGMDHDNRPWRNFYGRRHGKKLRTHQADLVDTRLQELAPPGVTWLDNPDRDPIDLTSLFPDKKEIWLEIGFGGGEHMLAQAQANPDVGIIGAEPFINGVAKLLAAIERAGVTNVSVTDADARDVMDILPPASIKRVFLLYPDPWPKSRHHKRRFVNPAQLDQLAKVMAPGVHLRIATDIEDYVRHSLLALDRHPDFTWTAEGPTDWRDPWPDWPSTRYEAKALREGRTPHYLTFQRR